MNSICLIQQTKQNKDKNIDDNSQHSYKYRELNDVSVSLVFSWYYYFEQYDLVNKKTDNGLQRTI